MSDVKIFAFVLVGVAIFYGFLYVLDYASALWRVTIERSYGEEPEVFVYYAPNGNFLRDAEAEVVYENVHPKTYALLMKKFAENGGLPIRGREAIAIRKVWHEETKVNAQTLNSENKILLKNLASKY